MENYFTILNIFISLIAATASIVAVYLCYKYQHINSIQSKTVNLQKFIDMSWLILNQLYIKSKKKEKNPNYQMDKLQIDSIKNDIVRLRAIAIGINKSEIYSAEVHDTVGFIYKHINSLLGNNYNSDEIKDKICRLQYLYDNGLLSKSNK